MFPWILYVSPMEIMKKDVGLVHWYRAYRFKFLKGHRYKIPSYQNSPSFPYIDFTMCLRSTVLHEKQRSSQRKCREHLINLPSHLDNATHQEISISKPCYEEKCMECLSFTTQQCTMFLDSCHYAYKAFSSLGMIRYYRINLSYDVNMSPDYLISCFAWQITVWVNAWPSVKMLRLYKRR